MKLLKALLLPAALVGGMHLTGCGSDDVQKAAEEAAGISTLEDTEKETILAEAGFDATALTGFKVHGGYEITENFPVDLTQTESVELPISLSQPAAYDATKGKSRSILFLRKKEFEIAGTKYTRFEVVTVAKVEPTETGVKLSIEGGEYTEHLDESQKPTKETQNGTYILVEGEGTSGMVYLKSTVKLKKVDGTEELVKDAWIFSDVSPFITRTGSQGEYLLPIPEGATGTLQAFHETIETTYSAPGTPKVASEQILKAGLLDQYKDEFNSKVSGATGDASKQAEASSAFDKLNTAVTDFFDAWTTIAIPMVFVQPPQTPPPQPTPPATPVETADPAPVPAATTTVVTREAATAPQIDLGCTGVDASGNTTFVTDGAKMDDYSTYKGWRVSGHVFAVTDEHTNIFGDPATIRATNSSRYPDQAKGYCVLSTGDGLYQKQKAADGTKDSTVFQPGPNGKGQTAEMWQKITTPSADSGYKYIKIRLAFFSQEFPQYVGTSFNDSFFVKFDETPDFIGRGTLNDLAGGKDAAADCKSKTFTSGTQVSCGEWVSVNGSGVTTGKLWDIDQSTQAVSNTKYFCAGSDASSQKCFHGYIPPRVLCKELDAATELGKELTLRFNVSDAGDSYYDSAIAIDSIVFSNEACDQTSFNGDARSKALTGPEPAGQ